MRERAWAKRGSAIGLSDPGAFHGGDEFRCPGTCFVEWGRPTIAGGLAVLPIQTVERVAGLEFQAALDSSYVPDVAASVSSCMLMMVLRRGLDWEKSHLSSSTPLLESEGGHVTAQIQPLLRPRTDRYQGTNEMAQGVRSLAFGRGLIVNQVDVRHSVEATGEVSPSFGATHHSKVRCLTRICENC